MVKIIQVLHDLLVKAYMHISVTRTVHSKAMPGPEQVVTYLNAYVNDR